MKPHDKAALCIKGLENLVSPEATPATPHDYSIGLTAVQSYLLDDQKPGNEKDDICRDMLQLYFMMNKRIYDDVEASRNIQPLCDLTKNTLKEIAEKNSNGHRTLTPNGLEDIQQALTVKPQNTAGNALVLFAD
jgi:hypothetical protein